MLLEVQVHLQTSCTCSSIQVHFETIELFSILFQDMTKFSVSMYANASTWCQMWLHPA